jgi:type I restriction enzyme, R subunit
MSQISELERVTQNRVIDLLKSQGYKYLGDLTKFSNQNVRENEFVEFQISQGVDIDLATRAFEHFETVTNQMSKSLYERNLDTYNLIRYGIDLAPELGEKKITIKPIDFQNPSKNNFYVAEEVTVVGKSGNGAVKRPDLVIYVNGIALAVIELKKSTVSIEEGIIQNCDNQSSEFIEWFFSTVQVIVAGNNATGLKYGTIGTKPANYLQWRDEETSVTELELSVKQLFAKNRLLQIIYEFINFDKGTKKIGRQNQIYGVNKAKKRILEQKGGYIWHTQGSGKSITMVQLAKWISENIDDSRVAILTDRTELDENIEGVFKGVNEKIRRVKSGADLLDALNTNTDKFMCSLIHKAGSAFRGLQIDEEDNEGKNLKEFANKVENEVGQIKDFKPKGNIFIFIDECHRTQAGELHRAMRKLLPNAIIIGFTGTPIFKNDKALTIRIFGEPIHEYRYDEAVRDGVVVDCLYEARDVNQRITDQEKIDLWFTAKTGNLNDYAKAELKQKWANLQNIWSSRERLGLIVSDIVLDFNTRPRLSDGRGNALLVASSIHEATVYFELFNQTELKGRVGVITSYQPKLNDLKGEAVGDAETLNVKQFNTYRKMIADFLGCTEDEAVNRVETYNTEVKEKFVHHPGQMSLLIVVDKLLTGFDAPSATYLYIDKKMRDHGLFQAMCRVNRVDPNGEDKKYGYIVDYKDLFESVEMALFDYTNAKGAFSNYDPSDIILCFKEINAESKSDLENQLEATRKLLEPVGDSTNNELLKKYFVATHAGDLDALQLTEGKRINFYKQVSSLIRSYSNICGFEGDAGYTQEEFKKIRQEIESFEEIKKFIKLASGDYVDLKLFEPDMRHLIDTYIKSDKSEIIADLTETPLLKILADDSDLEKRMETITNEKDHKSVAETIINNVKKEISEKSSANPIYFEKMSKILISLINMDIDRKEEYRKFLEKIQELAKDIIEPDTSIYPEDVRTNGQRAMYDILNENLETSTKVVEILRNAQADWEIDPRKTKNARSKLLNILDNDELMADRIIDIAKRHDEFVR